MERGKFLKAYMGFLTIYLTYRGTLFLLNEIIKEIDELQKIQELEKPANNNNNMKTRGGHNLVEKPPKKFKPIKSVASLIAKIPVVKKKLDVLRKVKQTLAVTVGLLSARLIESYDWWAIIIAECLVNLTDYDRAFLASLRRQRLGLRNSFICYGQVLEIIRVINSYEDINKQNVIETWINVLFTYESLVEGSQVKNYYFACITDLLTKLHTVNKPLCYFLFVLLCNYTKFGLIKQKTLLEIYAQLKNNGII